VTRKIVLPRWLKTFGQVDPRPANSFSNSKNESENNLNLTRRKIGKIRSLLYPILPTSHRLFSTLRKLLLTVKAKWKKRTLNIWNTIPTTLTKIGKDRRKRAEEYGRQLRGLEHAEEAELKEILPEDLLLVNEVEGLELTMNTTKKKTETATNLKMLQMIASSLLKFGRASLQSKKIAMNLEKIEQKINAVVVAIVRLLGEVAEANDMRRKKPVAKKASNGLRDSSSMMMEEKHLPRIYEKSPTRAARPLHSKRLKMAVVSRRGKRIPNTAEVILLVVLEDSTAVDEVEQEAAALATEELADGRIEPVNPSKVIKPIIQNDTRRRMLQFENRRMPEPKTLPTSKKGMTGSLRKTNRPEAELRPTVENDTKMKRVVHLRPHLIQHNPRPVIQWTT